MRFRRPSDRAGPRQSAAKERSGPRSPRARRLRKAREERRKLRDELGDALPETDPGNFVGVRFRAGELAAAVILFGGLLLMAMPQHGETILRLVFVALAAVAVLHALTVLVPEGSVTGWWRSPFEAPGQEPAGRPSRELERIRTRMSGRRQRIRGGRPLPPETMRSLRSLIVVALERQGLDPGDESQRPEIRRRLSPLAWSVFASDPLRLPRWYETRRPDVRRVAGVVERILDDIERVADGASAAAPKTGSPRARAR